MLKERYEEGHPLHWKTETGRGPYGKRHHHRRLHHRTRVPVTQKEQRKQQHCHEGERRPADHRHTLNTRNRDFISSPLLATEPAQQHIGNQSTTIRDDDHHGADGRSIAASASDITGAVQVKSDGP